MVERACKLVLLKENLSWLWCSTVYLVDDHMWGMFSGRKRRSIGQNLDDGMIDKWRVPTPVSSIY